MSRRTAIGFVVGLLGLAALTGCLQDLKHDWAEVLNWEKVKTPKPPKFAPASLQVAERVETLGRRIIAQNAFTGLDPLFNTIGVAEPMLFHGGTAMLYVSEGLVKKCKNDDQLAALLCTELGVMMAEQRAARGLGRDKDAISEVGDPGLGGGTKAGAIDPKPRERGKPTPAGDPDQFARDLMRGAGFDPAELGRVEPLLRQSDRGEVLRKQMAGSGAAPKWEK